MRFPSNTNCVAGLTVSVASLPETEPFLHGVLRMLGYGRTARGEDWVLWAREGAQLLARQVNHSDEVARGVTVQLRGASRTVVDAVHARAVDENWHILSAPAERPYAPGYYSVIVSATSEPGISLEVVHAWDDLPETQHGGERVRLAGVDGVSLGGYIFRPSGEPKAGVLVLHGYGGDATWTSWTGACLAREGFAALCISQRGWLGSTGDEDQGLRQPDDALAAAAWLQSQPGCAGPVAIIGYSQGGQVALLAAARAHAKLLAVVAFFPCTDLAAWAEQTGQAIADYLADFVAPDDIVACSPVSVADRIRCPALLIHGDADAHVPIAQSQAMVVANPAIELLIVKNASHFFTRDQYEDSRKQTVRFLNNCLAVLRGATISEANTA